MEFWTPHNLKNVTSGQWLEPPAEGGHILGGISTDTRNINPGQVFLAIAGDNFDGHDYLGAAIEAGASMLIVMDKEKAKKAPLPGAGAVSCLVVTDSITALQALARAYRDVLKQTNTMVIGVTGSNGKTTTRHLIHTALSTTLKGTQSPKSFNNHLGVPLTILAASTDDDFVVSEIGSNFPGEIAFLAEIVRPDIGVITSVGTAHIGHFGTKEAIANEKASLLLHVQPDGLVVIPDEGAAFDDMFGPDDPDRKMAPATAVATVLETLPKTIEVAQLDEFVFGDQVAIVQPSDPIRGNLVFEVGESLEIRLPMLG